MTLTVINYSWQTQNLLVPSQNYSWIKVIWRWTSFTRNRTGRAWRIENNLQTFKEMPVSLQSVAKVSRLVSMEIAWQVCFLSILPLLSYRKLEISFFLSSYLYLSVSLFLCLCLSLSPSFLWNWPIAWCMTDGAFKRWIACNATYSRWALSALENVCQRVMAWITAGEHWSRVRWCIIMQLSCLRNKVGLRQRHPKLDKPSFATMLLSLRYVAVCLRGFCLSGRLLSVFAAFVCLSGRLLSVWTALSKSCKTERKISDDNTRDRAIEQSAPLSCICCGQRATQQQQPIWRMIFMDSRTLQQRTEMTYFIKSSMFIRLGFVFSLQYTKQPWHALGSNPYSKEMISIFVAQLMQGFGQ